MNWKTFLVAGVIFFTGMLYAQTPDGETPANESECESQIGVANGLCSAYCEAMDCDSEFANASDMACEKIFDKYLRITGEIPPCHIGYCETDGAPCQSNEDCALLPGTCPTVGTSGGESCFVGADCHWGWCTTSDNACSNDTNCRYHTLGSCVWTCPNMPDNNCIL